VAAIVAAMLAALVAWCNLPALPSYMCWGIQVSMPLTIAAAA
jgi:hypothetical protein